MPAGVFDGHFIQSSLEFKHIVAERGAQPFTLKNTLTSTTKAMIAANTAKTLNKKSFFIVYPLNFRHFCQKFKKIKGLKENF